MTESLQYFRPGEEARMIARCQIGIKRDGSCLVTMTYPIKGYPWRRNPMRIYELHMEPALASELFTEVSEMQEHFPHQCLTSQLWSDQTERGSNAITRDSNGVTCHSIYIIATDGSDTHNYSMREDSTALRNSKLFMAVTALISPYETLPPTIVEDQGGGGNSVAL